MAAGVSVTFDFHHHRFCRGGLTEEQAFKAAIATWPKGVRPQVTLLLRSPCPVFSCQAVTTCGSGSVVLPLITHGATSHADHVQRGSQSVAPTQFLLFIRRFVPSLA